jgi:hypothetical protein
MLGKISIAKIAAGFLFLLAAKCGSGLAQERSLTGSVVGGWSYSRDKSSTDATATNPFSILRLDHSSYIIDPRFISYQILPRFSRGFEDFHLGQPQGTGIGLETNFLPERPWPVRFSFERVRRFSPTSGLGGANNNGRIKNVSSRLSLGTRYAVPGRPQISIQYNKYAGITNSENILLQGAESNGSGLSIYGSDSRKGWNLDGSFLRQKNRDLTLFGSQTGDFGETEGSTKSLNFSAKRDLGRDTKFFGTVLRNANSSIYGAGDFGFQFSRVMARLIHNPTGSGHRLWASIQGDAGRQSTTKQLQSSSNAIQNGRLELPSMKSNSRGLNSTLRYFIKPYLSISGQSQFTQTETPNSGSSAAGGSVFSWGPGIEFTKGRRYWTISSGYNLRISSTSSSEADKPRSLGHNLNAGLGIGDPSIVRAGATYSRSQSRIEGGILIGMKERSQRVALDLSKSAFGLFTIEGRGEIQRRRYESWSLASDSITRNFSLRLRLPRVELGYSKQRGTGDDWQFFWLNQMTGQTGNTNSSGLNLPKLAAGGVMLKAHGPRVPSATSALAGLSEEEKLNSGLFERSSLFNGSSSSGTSFTASIALTSSIRLYGSWQGQRQIAASGRPYRYEQQNATFEWRFRMMTVEASYYLNRYDVGTPIFRKLAMVKVTREFRVF